MRLPAKDTGAPSACDGCAPDISRSKTASSFTNALILVTPIWLVFGPCDPRLATQDDVQILVDLGQRAFGNDHGGERRLDDRRAIHDVARPELGVVVDRRVPIAGVLSREVSAAGSLSGGRSVRP